MSYIKKEVNIEGVPVVVEHEATYLEDLEDYDITIKSVKVKDSDVDISILLSEYIDMCMREYLRKEHWKDKENEHIATD